jgi:hypothetical protein
MTGRNDTAIESMSSVRGRIPPAMPPWFTQACLLFEADILLLTGQVELALTTAREGLDSQASATLHSPSFAGVFSRWLAMTSITAHEKENTCRQLDVILANLERHDALDQAEVLCACLHLGMEASNGRTEMRKLLTQKLTELPAAVTDQLTRLGLLRH